MQTFFKSMLVCVLATVMLSGLTGCDKHREYREEYQPTVQEPEKLYPITEEKGVRFAVLQEGALVASNIDGYKAVNPEFFAKLSGGIVVKAPEPEKAPKQGVPPMAPKIDVSTQNPDRKLTTISAHYLVPKELNGWVAVSEESFGKLVQSFMTSK